jgi:murein DD-endopeptidase MepM/ murein hydrolase activator NlpD
VTDTETPEKKPASQPSSFRKGGFWIGMLGTAVLIGVLGYWGWRVSRTNSELEGRQAGGSGQSATEVGGAVQDGWALPSVGAAGGSHSEIARSIVSQITIPARNSDWVTQYTIKKGDSVNSIAREFGLKDGSIVWGNTDLLADDANFLQPGQSLIILPVDGAFYKWKQSDNLESVAATWNTTVDAILNWPGNELNPLAPSIAPGQWLILPGGWKPYEWEAPLIRSGKSSTYALGAGVCLNGYDGPMGTGDWMWPSPASYHWLSGNAFSPPAHSGIDIAAYLGMPVYAADNGVIVYAGWSQNRDGTPGYGNLVIIDHLDGWHTFYGHLSQINVTCGEKMFGGMILGLAGSTGNSTGPHIHFEMRLGSAPQDPQGLLPAA